MKTIKLLQICLLAALSLGVSSAVQAEMKKDTELVAVMVHSDHCGSCKILDPQIKAAQKALAGKPVKFVTFDITSDESKAATAKMAEGKGLKSVYDEVGGKSGKLYLVNPKSKKVVASFTKADDSAAMIQKVESLL